MRGPAPAEPPGRRGLDPEAHVLVVEDDAAMRLRPLAVKRALGNLVDNAVKHGGAARVTLEEAPGAVTVRVEDDGPGIPEVALEAVFEPFHRLDASRNRGTGGTGLGLAIVRQVVVGHGGTVRLANRPEGGLVATVRLPRTPIAAAQVPGAAEGTRA
jgi:signal transduction histidine kinase